jgi:shikimate kinase
MNIVLIGYRCSGKTSVGEILAEELVMDFLDTDALIEKQACCSLEVLVSLRGWDDFRMMEKELVCDLSERDNQVIATGGGVVMDEGNVKNLKKNAWIVWLKGGPEVLRARMSWDQSSGRGRPSLTGADPLEEIEQVLNIRNPLYEQAKDFMVDTSGLSIQEAAALIVINLPTKSFRR